MRGRESGTLSAITAAVRSKTTDRDTAETLDRVRELCAWVAAQSFRETIRTAELPEDLRAGVPELADREKIELRFLKRRVEHAELQLTPKVVGRKRRISDRARALSSAIRAQATRPRAAQKMPSPAVIRGTLRPPAEMPEGAYWQLDPPSVPFFEERYENVTELAERASTVREQIWRALISQAGADPRSAKLSWSSVVFPDGFARQLETIRGTRFVEREFYFPSGLDGELITGRLLLPEKHREKRSAVLYQHLAGGCYALGTEELHRSWNLDGSGTFADKLIDDGHIVMATDARGFGRRRAVRGDGSGPRDDYQQHEDLDDEKRDFYALKESGRSRYAKRSYEDYLALRLLAQHPLVDSSAIGAIGMDMGCVRTWTLAALAGKALRRAVPLGTWPRYQDLLAANKLGCYRDGECFQGVLALDTESFVLAGMETKTLAMIGDQDPSSPGWKKIFDYGTWASRTLGLDTFETLALRGVGHTWTPEAIALALEFLRPLRSY
jgi:hypothetical protein